MAILHQHSMRLDATQLPLPGRIPRIVMSNIAEAIPSPNLAVDELTTMRGLSLPVTSHVLLSFVDDLFKHYISQKVLCSDCRMSVVAETMF
jgi:Cu/Ag efflux pump CusA